MSWTRLISNAFEQVAGVVRRSSSWDRTMKGFSGIKESESANKAKINQSTGRNKAFDILHKLDAGRPHSAGVLYRRTARPQGSRVEELKNEHTNFQEQAKFKGFPQGNKSCSLLTTVGQWLERNNTQHPLSTLKKTPGKPLIVKVSLPEYQTRKAFTFYGPAITEEIRRQYRQAWYRKLSGQTACKEDRRSHQPRRKKLRPQPIDIKTAVDLLTKAQQSKRLARTLEAKSVTEPMDIQPRRMRATKPILMTLTPRISTPPPRTKAEISRTQLQMPHIQVQIPHTKVQIPRNQVRIQRTQDRIPRVEVYIPRTQVQMPRTQHQYPRTEVQIPRTQVQIPRGQVQTPSTYVQTPRTQAPIPRSQVQTPSTHVQTPHTQVPQVLPKSPIPQIKVQPQKTTPSFRIPSYLMKTQQTNIKLLSKSEANVIEEKKICVASDKNKLTKFKKHFYNYPPPLALPTTLTHKQRMDDIIHRYEVAIKTVELPTHSEITDSLFIGNKKQETGFRQTDAWLNDLKRRRSGILLNTKTDLITFLGFRPPSREIEPGIKEKTRPRPPILTIPVTVEDVPKKNTKVDKSEGLQTKNDKTTFKPHGHDEDKD